MALSKVCYKHTKTITIFSIISFVYKGVKYMRSELYDDITILYRSDEKEIILVQHMIKNLFYVKKIIRTKRDIQLYEELRKHPHENLANVIECVNNHTKTIVIEEFVNGCTLEYKLSQHGLSLKEIYHIMMQLFSVFEHIHSLIPPIIHRDIKPDNILVDKQNVYIIDFEIAKCYYEKQRDERIVGSVGYAAPEQYHGYSDQRSDIFSLGILLFEMINASFTHGCLHDNFHLFIKKCTSIDAADRYLDIHEVRYDFLQIYKKHFKVCRKHTNHR